MRVGRGHRATDHHVIRRDHRRADVGRVLDVDNEPDDNEPDDV